MKRDYGRTTITVPFELKERMKKARAHVNWSAVACEAFEQKLEELGPIEEITSVKDALKRMQNLKESSPSRERSPTGREAGTYWALNFARPGQLKRIEDFRNAMTNSEWEELMTSREASRELAKCIVPRDWTGPRPGRGREGRGRAGAGPGRHRRPRMKGDHGPGPERDVWRSILDRRPDHREFFLGFAEGALDVWKQIKDQL